jgi:SAM-dependent methyltransferase
MDDVFARLPDDEGGLYTTFAPVYAALYDDADRVAGQFEAVRGALDADAERVLETGCGAGDLLTRLAAEYDALGLDVSPQMAATAAETADAEALAARMDVPPFGATFDAVVSMGCALGHVRPPGAIVEAIRAAHGLLESGGQFVATVHDEDHYAAEPEWREQTVRIDGYVVEQRDAQVVAEDAADGPGAEFEWRVNHALTDVETGETRTAEHVVPIRSFDTEELRDLLAEAGFAEVGIRDRDFVGDDGRGLVVVARA